MTKKKKRKEIKLNSSLAVNDLGIHAKEVVFLAGVDIHADLWINLWICPVELFPHLQKKREKKNKII